MSGSSTSGDYGGGLPKMALGASIIVIQILANISAISDRFLKLSSTGHALAATIVLAFFIVYVLMDMIKFHDEMKVTLAGLAAILIAGFWWLSFLAMHGVPAEPLLPPHLYPPKWAYLLMALYLGYWAYWDMKDAMLGEVNDKPTVFTSGVVLMVGIGLSLFLTLQLPAASQQ